jgi:hypothetical protein
VSFEGLLDNSVTVKVATYTNVRGVRTASYADTAFAAAVQPMRARARDSHGLEAGETGYSVFLASDPGCKRGDKITWGNHTLECLARARDEAGRGVVFILDCRELD